MAALYTSHASIGNSTMKDARDLTGSFFGGADGEHHTESELSVDGPEDFTQDIVNYMSRKKLDSTVETQDEPTESSIGGPEDFTENLVNYMTRNKPVSAAEASAQASELSVAGPEDLTQDTVNHVRPNKPSSAFEIQDDPTESSIGGPEDFTQNIVNYMTRNKPVSAVKTQEQLEPTESSIGGPEDFTQNIVNYMTRNKPASTVETLQQHEPTGSSISKDFTLNTVQHTERRQGSDSSLRSKGRVIAKMRKPSNGSTKTTQRHSPILSPNHRDTSSSSAGNNSSDGESKSTRPSSMQSVRSPARTQGKVRGSKEPDRKNNNNHLITQDRNVTESIIVKDGQTFRKTIRTPLRQKMQPTVSDEDEELDRVEIVYAPTPPRPVQIPPETPRASPAMSVLEDELTNPLGESTPAPHTTADHEMELLRQQLEDMKTALAQRDETINVLQTRLTAKETECEQLQDVLQSKSSAAAAAERREKALQDSMRAAEEQATTTANVLQTRLAAKETECERLQDALVSTSSAAAGAEQREKALQDSMRAAEEQATSATAIAGERFAVVKDALLAAEDEAAAAAEQAAQAIAAAESRADAATARCHRLEKDVRDLTASARAARTEAKNAKKEQAEREAFWVARADILLAECDRRGKALLIKIGEQELPGVRDEKGRQAYRYQREVVPSQRGREGGSGRSGRGKIETW